MEVYVDNMLEKSRKKQDYISDLGATFQVLQRHKMNLNVAKFSFGVSSDKFLEFLVNYRGLEANPEKIKALQNFRAPTTIKEMQKLTGMVAALNRFISNCSDKCYPFLQALKGGKRLNQMT